MSKDSKLMEALICIPGAKFDSRFNEMMKDYCGFQQSWFSNKELSLGNDQYKKHKWRLIFEHLRQVEWQTMKLDYLILLPDIIVEISQPLYTKLTVLNLNCNDIDNIEPFYSLNMPNIKEILLLGNKITQFKSFNKLNAPNLKYLHITWNLMNNIDISRFNMHSNICILSLAQCYTFYDQDSKQSQDISCLSKLEIFKEGQLTHQEKNLRGQTSLEEYYLSRDQRIKQHKALTAIKKNHLFKQYFEMQRLI